MIAEVEILQASLAIRNFFLQTTVKGIYENVGQVLSAIKMELEILSITREDANADKLAISGNLLGQSVRDLRTMAKNFYPEEDIAKEDGLITVLTQTLTILGLQISVNVDRSFMEKDLGVNNKLVTFKVVLDALLSIQRTGGELRRISIASKKGFTLYMISCSSNKQQNSTSQKTFKKIFTSERSLAAINGSYELVKGKMGITGMIIKVPIQKEEYE